MDKALLMSITFHFVERVLIFEIIINVFVNTTFIKAELIKVRSL